MIRVLTTISLLSVFLSAGASFAQDTPPSSVKIYSGFLHQYNVRSKGSLWSVLFGSRSPKEDILHDRQCTVEFKSSVPFSNRSVAVMPESLTYVVRFNKNPFQKYVIKIMTNDDQEYSIAPDHSGKIFDAYIIYLILGSGIDHLEIVSPSNQEDQDKYVLDKLEVHDN